MALKLTAGQAEEISDIAGWKSEPYNYQLILSRNQIIQVSKNENLRIYITAVYLYIF